MPMGFADINEQGEEPQQRAVRLVVGVIFSFLLQVSLSMKFQASRFSASGRKMPLEPRRSEACRSCQPMHVLSFVEGRKYFFCLCPEFLHRAFGVRYRFPGIGF